MPFGIIGRMGPEMRQVVRFGDQSTEGVLLSANLWCTIVTSGDFMAYVCDSASTRPSSKLLLTDLLLLMLLLYRRLTCLFSVHWHYAVIYQCLYISQTLLVPARHTNLSFFLVCRYMHIFVISKSCFGMKVIGQSSTPYKQY